MEEEGRDALLGPQPPIYEAVGVVKCHGLAGNIVEAAELSNDDTIRVLPNEPVVAELSTKRGLWQLFELMSSILFCGRILSRENRSE